MRYTVLRWGVLGAGHVSSDFCSALKYLSTATHENQLLAVASRRIEKAEEYAQKFGAERIYGSYEDLIADEDVDIVYIATINTTHKDLCMAALQAGKHVLCEKSLAVNEKETLEIIQYAKQSGCFLMENFWSLTFPGWQSIKSRIASAGESGQPKLITGSFCGKKFQQRARFHDASIGGGMVTSFATYPLAYMYSLFGPINANRISSVGEKMNSGVDRISITSIEFDNNTLLQFTTGSNIDYQDGIKFISPDGTYSVLPPYYAPATIITPDGKREEFPIPDIGASTVFPNGAGFAYLIEHVKQCIEEGRIESNIFDHEGSAFVIRLTDEIRRQLGVVYPQDEQFNSSLENHYNQLITDT